ncbi:predicted protein [Naegleria gruberi]|uniref:Predicted protein n=1 Tax=Naegleria gruberi TaxID=5762 RepID=D2VI94_NAEGR|nr:uncharacterized protein NAEGRDRAFT_49772 [Naegleria gruberi]EFC43471.1 predicted protein [Naegleria gruberi]|eukprot:XP_002676215.1 predicted protein [Naegleria gruberi strain NEG-M]
MGNHQKASGDIYFKTVHIIPHSHWDVGWLKTKKDYYEQEVRNIIGSVIKALTEKPDRKFIFVEMSFISYWWEDSSVSKEEKNLFMKFLNEKRIEFALAAMTMSDEAANTYSSVIHTLTRGHQYVIDTFNTKDRDFIPTSSFRIDPFGSTTTMTRIYRESGLSDTVIMRIPQGKQTEMRDNKQMSFYWNLADGSSVYSNIMDYQYCVRALFFDGESSISYGSDEIVADEMHREILKYSLGFNQSDIMLPGGCDFSFQNAPERFAKIEKGMKYINDHPEIYPYKVKFSLLSEYMQASRPKKSGDVYSYNADFMPYADGPNAFWTGYYTSYPILKQAIRTAESFFRAAKALFAISTPYVKDDQRKGFIEQGFKQLDQLAVSMADVTHHDAVTGTSKLEVTKDYIDSLSDGVKEAKQALTQSLTALITSKLSQSDIVLEDYLNKLVSNSFSFTELMQKFSSLISQRKYSYSIPIVLFNSLSWDIENHVETIGPDEAAPFSSIIKQICFFSMEGTRLKSQYSKSVLAPDEYDLHFVVPKIPALGYTTVLIKPCDTMEQGSINEEIINIEDKPYTISNSKTSVTFCKKNNMVSLCSIEKEGNKYEISQKLMTYTGISGYTFGVNQQKSGAYIFAPKSQEPTLITPTSSSLLISNSISNNIFTQVEQTVEKYVKQIVRLYQPEIAQKQGYDLEYIYYFDDIPGDDEIITKFDASAFISSKGVFYCDKNGLETVKSNTKSKVEATYLPIVFNCFIRDEEKKTQLTLFVSETHGAASMKNGELEIMLHRRTLSDDGRGVDQPVNDESNIAINIKKEPISI